MLQKNMVFQNQSSWNLIICFGQNYFGILYRWFRASEKFKNPELNETQGKILKLLWENNQLSAAKLAEKIGVASRNIESNIKKLKEDGFLIRHGSPKSGYWEVIAYEKNNSVGTE